ncbi:MAG: 16S rRNA (guanine(527)-N(7))-methyltransferase RsmG [Pseudomonadales bacterium]
MPDRSALNEELAAGLRQLALPPSVALNAAQLGTLLAYAELLLRWNKAYNLIGRASEEDIVSRHLLDSLSAAPYISGKRWLDVGCGAGLPGIPLAMALPDAHFTLLDSNGKKHRFVLQAKSTLALLNIEPLQQRAEEFDATPLFDGIISRAFASLGKGIQSAGHLCAPGGKMCFMKGRINTEELREVRKPFTVQSCERLHVPGSSAERHLIELRKSA